MKTACQSQVQSHHGGGEHDQHKISKEDEQVFKEKLRAYHELFPIETNPARVLTAAELEAIVSKFEGYNLSQDDIAYLQQILSHNEDLDAAVEYLINIKRQALIISDEVLRTRPRRPRAHPLQESHTLSSPLSSSPSPWSTTPSSSEPRSLTAVITGINLVSSIFGAVPGATRLTGALNVLGQVLGFLDFILSLVAPAPSEFELIMARFDEMERRLTVIDNTLADIQRQISMLHITNFLAPHENNVLRSYGFYQSMIQFAGTAHEGAYESQFLNHFRSQGVRASLETIMHSFFNGGVFSVNNLGQELVNITRNHHTQVVGVFQGVSSVILYGTHLCLYAAHRENLNITHEENYWRDLTTRVNNLITTSLNTIKRNMPDTINQDFRIIFDNNGFGNLPRTVESFQRIGTTLSDHFRSKFGGFANFEIVTFARVPGVGVEGRTVHRAFWGQGSNGHDVVIIYEDRDRTLANSLNTTPARRQQILDENRLLWRSGANANNMANTMHQQNSSILPTALVVSFGDFVQVRYHRISNLVASLFLTAGFPGSWGVQQVAYIGNSFHSIFPH